MYIRVVIGDTTKIYVRVVIVETTKIYIRVVIDRGHYKDMTLQRYISELL